MWNDYFLSVDLGTYLDTDILVHIPLHVSDPPHETGLVVAVARHHLLPVGLSHVVLYWVDALALH